MTAAKSAKVTDDIAALVNKEMSKREAFILDQFRNWAALNSVSTTFLVLDDKGLRLEDAPRSTTLSLPIKTTNTANSSQGISRAGMFARAREKKQIKGAVLLAVRPRVAGFVGPFAVHVVRLAPSKGLDKHDGLPMSQKWVVDAIAEALGVDDQELVVTYDQRREKSYGVVITVKEMR